MNHNYALYESFTSAELSLVIEDLKTTINTRQYLLDEHLNLGSASPDYYKRKEAELNTFVQMVVVLTDAFEVVKNRETVNAN